MLQTKEKRKIAKAAFKPIDKAYTDNAVSKKQKTQTDK